MTLFFNLILGLDNSHRQEVQKVLSSIHIKQMLCLGSTPNLFIFQFKSADEFDRMPEEIKDFLQEGENIISLDSKESGKETVPKLTFLWLGNHPDNSFYRIVNGGKKKKKEIKLPAMEYGVLLCLYNAEGKKKSIDELLYEGKVSKHKLRNNISSDKKGYLQTIISRLNSKLYKVFNIEHCVKLDDKTKNHYYLDIDCRSGEWSR